MAGQGTVTINTTQWQVDIVNTWLELTQGLSGLSSIPPNTGMLFDLSEEQIIIITTQEMLFNLDIIFFNEALVVTEVFFDVAPGVTQPSTIPARYFLEVNAGEAVDIVIGSQAIVQVIVQPGLTWEGIMAAFIPIVVLMAGMGMVMKATGGSSGGPKALLGNPGNPEDWGELGRVLVLRGADPEEIGHLIVEAEETIPSWYKGEERRRALALRNWAREELQRRVREPGVPPRILKIEHEEYGEQEARARAMVEDLVPLVAEENKANRDYTELSVIASHRGFPSLASMLLLAIASDEKRHATLLKEKIEELMSKYFWTSEHHSIHGSERQKLVDEFGSWAVGRAEAICPEGDVACVRREAERLITTMRLKRPL